MTSNNVRLYEDVEEGKAEILLIIYILKFLWFWTFVCVKNALHEHDLGLCPDILENLFHVAVYVFEK